MSEKDLSISGSVAITICYGIVGAFFMLNFLSRRRYNYPLLKKKIYEIWLIITNAKRKYIDDWLTKLKRDGEDIRANYLPSSEPLPKDQPYKYYPIMIPPTPLSQYVDRMNMKLLNELKKKDRVKYDGIIKQRLDSKDGYEAEVIVFRALERLKLNENIIFVLHSLKYSQKDYHYFVGEVQEGECDFIIMGRNYFVIIEVKKNQADVKKAMDQAKRTEKLIAGIMAQITDKVVPQILNFAACPYLKLNKNKKNPFAGNLKDARVITKEDLKDDRSFYSWWEINVIDNVDQQTSSMYNEETRDILIALWANENNKCEKERCSLEWNVLKIDKELKDGLITFEPKKDTGTASLDVVEAPEVIRKYCGVKYLTTEQNKVWQRFSFLKYKTEQNKVFQCLGLQKYNVFERSLRYKLDHQDRVSEFVLRIYEEVILGSNREDELYERLKIHKTEEDKVFKRFHGYQTDRENELFERLLRYKTEEESSLRDHTEEDELYERLLRYKTEEDKVFECFLRYKTKEDKAFERLQSSDTLISRTTINNKFRNEFEVLLKLKTEKDLVFQRLQKYKTEEDKVFKPLLRDKTELFQHALRSHIPFLVWIDGPAGSGKTVLLAGRLLQLALQLDTVQRRSVVFKFVEGNSNTNSTEGEENLTIYQRACQKAGVDVELIFPSNSEEIHSLTDQIINSNKTVIIVELKYVDIKYLKYTFANLESFQRNVIIDDFQCLLRWYDKAGIGDLLNKLNRFYRVSGFSLLIACDLGQWYWRDREYIESVRNCIERYWAFGKQELKKNLRNTCDISDVLSVFRDKYIECALDCDMLPKQLPGHFIRGPLTEFHMFEKFDRALITIKFNQELMKLCRINDSDKSKYGTIVYNYVDEALIESISEVNKEKIKVCHCAQINSAEWPAVLVLHNIWGDNYEKEDFTQLYLMISRARVKCSVLMYKRGRRKKEKESLLILLEKIEPLARVIKY